MNTVTTVMQTMTALENLRAAQDSLIETAVRITAAKATMETLQSTIDTLEAQLADGPQPLIDLAAAVKIQAQTVRDLLQPALPG